jgi:hypothetical protein
VVITIIAVLAALLFPVLARPKKPPGAPSAETIFAKSESPDARTLTITGILILASRVAQLFTVASGRSAKLHGLAPHHRFPGLLGLGYYQYFGGNKKIFGCPDATLLDDYRDLGYTYPHEFWANSSYGQCQFLTIPYIGQNTQNDPKATGPLRTSSYLSPTSMIFCQDSFEPLMAGPTTAWDYFPELRGS